MCSKDSFSESKGEGEVLNCINALYWGEGEKNTPRFSLPAHGERIWGLPW